MKKKRHFSPLQLKVSPRYVYPARRRRWLGLGLLLALAALLWTVLDFFLFDAGFVSSGPLSSQHARLASDCAACHSSPNSIPSSKCAFCHESGRRAADDASAVSDATDEELALYGYPAHYVYFSEDLERQGQADLEGDCSHCHSEHRGRAASISRVEDSRCVACHGFSSLAAHPEFLAPGLLQAARGGLEGLQEQDGLKFPHAVHVNKVLPDERKLEGEAACLFCHRPEDSGAGFRPMSFELHCAEGCHLNKDSPLLPLALDGFSGSAGVLAPEDLRRADPAAPCLPSIDDAAFRLVTPANPRRIRLQVISHRDCWIEENLRILRRTQHPDLGLADLLAERSPGQVSDAGGDPDDDQTPGSGSAQEVDPVRLRERYRDALEALSARLLRVRQLDRASQAGSEDQAESRAQTPSGLSRELRRGGAAEARLRDAAELLDRPGAVGPLSMLAAPSHEPRGRLDQLLLQTFQDLSVGGHLPKPAFRSASPELLRSLTQPCRECHFSSSMGLAPVNADQKTLLRSRFDHSAHLVQMQCADCHSSVTTAEDDQGAMLHLPSIDTCRGCHNPGVSADDCVTCHVFHPHKDRRTRLLSRAGGDRR